MNLPAWLDAAKITQLRACLFYHSCKLSWNWDSVYFGLIVINGPITKIFCSLFATFPGLSWMETRNPLCHHDACRRGCYPIKPPQFTPNESEDGETFFIAPFFRLVGISFGENWMLCLGFCPSSFPHSANRMLLELKLLFSFSLVGQVGLERYKCYTVLPG